MRQDSSGKSFIDIIGGGPSGMMAAITAAGNGARVRLWEKNGSLGRKLLATGNGRCNFTNCSLSNDCYHAGDMNLARGVIEGFGLERTLAFFGDLGLVYYSDARGRYFPRSNEAASVLFCLEQALERYDVKVNLHSEIADIARTDGGWEVRQRGAAHRSEAVIMACGGSAGPQFGSDGHSFRMAAKLNHAMITPKPSLVPLALDGSWFHKLQGLRMDVKISIRHERECLGEITDEVLFTQYGLSGPLALKSSRIPCEEGTDCQLNFLPYMEEAAVTDMLKERRAGLGIRRARDFLNGLLPEKLGLLMVQQSWLDQETACSDISDLQVERLKKNLCAWKIKIKGLRSFREAQVTAGGIDCRQVFPESLMSKKAPGLFFCGEMLDVDGDTGGYNLQWCWSSGYAAGLAAAGYLKAK